MRSGVLLTRNFARQAVRRTGADANAAGLLVACPMQSTLQIKALDTRSLAPVSERETTETDYVAWWYPRAPKGASCGENNTVELAPGGQLPHNVRASSGRNTTGPPLPPPCQAHP